eukprot:NODE_655_length_4980_cov_0.331899.p3 type:complete len:177 gc:universal NODE_655_length_4980_cov_0.331899:1196-1726(+)
MLEQLRRTTFKKMPKLFSEELQGSQRSVSVQTEIVVEPFQCSICLDVASSPITTKCGHLFCFKCIKSWFDVSFKLSCPVCKQNSGFKHLIPIYINNDEKHAFDYQEEIPEEFNNRNRPRSNPFHRFNPFAPYAFGDANFGHQFVFDLNGTPIRNRNESGWLLIFGAMLMFFVVYPY